MSISSIQNSGSYAIRETRVVLHYHPKSGQILHMYTATVFEGVEGLSDEALLEQAVDHAKSAGVKSLGKRPYLIAKDPGFLMHPCQVDVKTLEIQRVEGAGFHVKGLKSLS
ncbi:hypothetical protein [Neogemmobacter tilapiae]|uniref:Uncharacterized protein n=1 Tax=Neogemmobacter tilapiae TaxID=875041 RepID=A0A918TFT9_9RHOB|nr:hypothetical protein [Gemmobacter tilapiae]GHC44240.1 hypothetical protein GCM10007315_01770 [Gemmobacter tilapiae]